MKRPREGTPSTEHLRGPGEEQLYGDIVKNQEGDSTRYLNCGAVITTQETGMMHGNVVKLNERRLESKRSCGASRPLADILLEGKTFLRFFHFRWSRPVQLLWTG
jgi:hypothetical protein